MKNLFLGVLSLFLLLGCASRKVRKDNSVTTTEIAVQTQKAVDCTAVKTKDIDFNIIDKKMILKPIDTSKPIFFSGQEIKNATVEFESHTDTTKERHKETVVKKVKSKETMTAQQKEVVDKKETERAGQSMLLMWLLILALIICIVYIVYGWFR